MTSAIYLATRLAEQLVISYTYSIFTFSNVKNDFFLGLKALYTSK